MSEIKHTSGPWTVMPEESDKSYVRIRGTRLGERYKVANVVTPDYPGAQETEAQETRANARLIAAAPDLLLALDEMVREFVKCFPIYYYAEPWAHDKNVALKFAREAIAKATGGQS